MFSSLFKLASATVRSNIAIGGCRCYPRTNPVSRILKAKSVRPSQENLEEVDYDSERGEPVHFNERKEMGLQQRIIKPHYGKQLQQNVEELDDEEVNHGEKEIVELNPDDVIPISEELRTVAKEQETVSRKKKKKKEKFNDRDRTGVVEIGENVFKYKVLGKDTKDLANELLECKSSKLREKNQKFMLEGKRLIYDAITANITPIKIFFTRTEDLKKFKLPLNIELYRICYEDLQVWSNVKTSQGLMGIFKLPSLEFMKPGPNSVPLTIICDQIREPGNMGSIIRVAAGVGCSKLILTKGCVDIWDSKVLRSAAGAHFRIPLIKSQTWDEISEKLPDDYSLFLADSEIPEEPDEDLEGKPTGSAFKKKFMVSDNVPLCAYHSQSYWGKKSVVLVIGGETVGLSLNAYQLAVEKCGKRICIPLFNGVESLNSGVALSILSYEIRRQYCSEKNEQKEERLGNNESYQAVGLYSE